jgi:hypothetical protein
LSQKQFADSIVSAQPNLVSFPTAMKNLMKNLENLLFLQGCVEQLKAGNWVSTDI